MTVTLTADAVGKKAGDTYTGDEEAFLLAQGLAKQDGYTGPGVSNTGPMAEDVAHDETKAENREKPKGFPSSPAPAFDGFANDATNLVKNVFPAKYDFDPAGADDEKPSNLQLAPATGVPGGGTVVTITGDNLAGVTGVTFGGAAGTALDVSKAADGTVKVTTPSHTAGAVDVVVTDNVGSTTLTGGFTYA